MAMCHWMCIYCICLISSICSTNSWIVVELLTDFALCSICWYMCLNQSTITARVCSLNYLVNIWISRFQASFCSVTLAVSLLLDSVIMSCTCSEIASICPALDKTFLQCQGFWYTFLNYRLILNCLFTLILVGYKVTIICISLNCIAYAKVDSSYCGLILRNI